MASEVLGSMVRSIECKMGWCGREEWAKERELSLMGRGVAMRRRPRDSSDIVGREESLRRRVAVSREELICGTGVDVSRECSGTETGPLGRQTY